MTHSFLIVSRDEKSLLDKAHLICKEEGIDKLDINLLESEKQIGIPDVKNIQSKAYLKPIKSKQKAIIILANQGLTIEAQNALLKLLEEPPNNTIIILLSESVDSVLPTIRSRCKIIELNNVVFKNEDNIKYLELLDSLEKAGTGERLKIAEDLSKNKEHAIESIEKIILILRDNLLETQDKKIIKKLNQFQKTYNTIKNTNVSLRLTIENLFLNF